MKTRIKKIVIIAAALLFVGSGVSFAHDWNDRDHKPPGKAYGHYKVKEHDPVKTKRQDPQRYAYREVRDHRYDNHHRGQDPREDVIYKVVLKDPNLVIKVIVKDQ